MNIKLTECFFLVKKTLFLAQSTRAGVAGKLAFRPYDTMAGNDGRKGVGAQSPAYRSRGARSADLFRDPSVTSGFPLGDGGAGFPDTLVEV
jgi:hypothetical protein